MAQQTPKHSQTCVENVTYDETKKTNGNNNKTAKNSTFFVKFCDPIMDLDPFASFDAII